MMPVTRTPSFIASPFTARVDYEAFLALPDEDKPAALAAAVAKMEVAKTVVQTPVVRRALLSVSDKAGLIELATALAAHGVEMLSTGGTAKAIRTAGLPVKDVSEFTNSPEIMDGRVKTLHPRVHGGILMRELPGFSDDKQLEQIGGAPIDLVVVNLYPFSATVAKGAPYDDCVENIDIGGPTMVRAAAKNHARVSVVVQPSDYAAIIASLPAGPTLEERKRLAARAFSHTATYDQAVATWFQGETGSGRDGVTVLKYGCNPQQKPASVRGLLSPSGPQPMPFDVLSGVPGYINLLDALNAWQLVREVCAAWIAENPARTHHARTPRAYMQAALSSRTACLRSTPHCSPLALALPTLTAAKLPPLARSLRRLRASPPRPRSSTSRPRAPPCTRL